MSLSCSCSFDSDGLDWWWEGDSGLKPVLIERRKKCCSCKQMINVGTEYIEFYRYRHPKNDIEERIYGDERVPIASSYMCEECSGLYLALDELGYDCLDINEPMKNYVIEYNEMREELKKKKKI